MMPSEQLKREFIDITSLSSGQIWMQTGGIKMM
jgi:hypothetical protein